MPRHRIANFGLLLHAEAAIVSKSARTILIILLVILVPFLIYTDPRVARNVLRFRAKLLPQARERAAELGGSVLGVVRKPFSLAEIRSEVAQALAS